MVRIVGPWTPVRAAILLLVLLATVVALAGAVIYHPWDPFPPRGLIAYTVPLEQAGSTGIRLVAADGTGARQISSAAINTFDHSPRWSRDGRTLLFARNSGLDPFGSCPGVGSIVLYDPATGTERIVATDLRPIDTVEWSPAGDQVAYLWPPPSCGAPAELGVVDVATGRVTTSPLGDGAWRIRWVGSTVSPERVDQHVDAPPGQSATPWEVRSPDGATVASFTAPGRNVTSHLTLTPRAGIAVDLGPGGAPVWSADGTILAFVQFVDRPSEYDVSFRDRLAVAEAATGKVWSLADVFDADVIIPAGTGALPRIYWTPDGRAIYWLDYTGGHVVEVASGRTVDLPIQVIGSDELQWQPRPN